MCGTIRSTRCGASPRWRWTSLGQAKFGDVVDIIVSQQRFIASMQGRTATFSTFSDAQFDEATFEAQLTAERTPTMICLYWILKLKARFLSGDYAEALVGSRQGEGAAFGPRPSSMQMLDYFYYTALAVAALFEKASAEQQTEWRELLTSHREQLREWAENYPPTFADKHALVSAEIARLEGRDADAMRLYEEAIRSAHEHGFVQNEARPMKSPRDSMRRGASRGLRTSICGTPGTAISSGARTARSGNSTNATRTCRRKGPRPPAPPRLGRLSRSWTSRRWSRLRRPCRARLSSRT